VSSGNLLLWESPEAGSIAARVAIAGDFLPAGRLTFPEGQNWREMTANLSPCFVDVAVSFVNLEGTLDTGDLHPRPICGLGQAISAPVESLDYLQSIRAQAVSIANNHIYDFHSAGVSRTRNAIIQRGMIALGAGHTLESAPEVFVWHGPGNIHVGFWAAARATSDPASRKSPGVEPATINRATQTLELMEKHDARFRVALLHAGCMRTNRPDPEDVELMNSIADLGFNVVAASHSHFISGAKLIPRESGQPSFCFYGLGSLVSGLVDSPLEKEGLVVVAGLDANGDLIRIEVRPVLLNQNGFGESPPSKAKRVILRRFRLLCNEIANGSYRREYYRDTSRGLMRLYLRDAQAAFRQGGIAGLVRKAGRMRMRHLRKLAHKVIG